MLKWLAACFFIGSSIFSTAQIQLEADPFAAAFFSQNITQEELKEHLTKIASPEFEGRETGSEGQEKAGRYIIKSLRQAGIEKAPQLRDYHQTLAFTILDWQHLGLRVDSSSFKHMRDFLALKEQNQNLPELQASEVIFMGYGIDDANYSDYLKADVVGKVIMIYLGEPLNEDSISYVTGTQKLSRWSSSLDLKLEAAKRHKARAVLIVDPQIKKRFSANRSRELGPSMFLKAVPAPTTPNHVFISTKVAKQIIGDQEVAFMNNLTEIREKGQGRPLPIQSQVIINQHLTRSLLYSKNIIGYLPGMDSTLQDEVIILSAHYDHLGKRGNSIFHGADDNGSGTTAVLEIMATLAEAKKEGLGPKRSVACIFFTGEEKGLLGSKYYAEHPVIPLSQTVADVNVDMIGRTDEAHQQNPNYIYVIGSNRLSTELHQINEAVNASFTHLDLDYTYNAKDDPNKFYYRSDHYNFAKHGIPSIFYFSGVHKDYHRPSDIPEKILYNKYETVAKLIFHTVWELANRSRRIIVDVKDDTNYNR
ncbi:MAG: M28 family peptidase [Saprospiraceae bacterium]|nr:M28 family peptidase [Saprospiraceae bacterium]